MCGVDWTFILAPKLSGKWLKMLRVSMKTTEIYWNFVHKKVAATHLSLYLPPRIYVLINFCNKKKLFESQQESYIHIINVDSTVNKIFLKIIIKEKYRCWRNPVLIYYIAKICKKFVSKTKISCYHQTTNNLPPAYNYFLIVIIIFEERTNDKCKTSRKTRGNFK